MNNESEKWKLKGVIPSSNSAVMDAEKIGMVLLIASTAAFAIAFYQKRKSPICRID